MLLRCSFVSADGQLLLKGVAEVSMVDEGGVVRKASLKGDAVVSPGTSAPVASSEDPSTHKRFELAVTATRLR